jgi:hypothetical protein
VLRFAIEVGFDDGLHGIVDLADIAGRGVFSQWQKEGVFESVKITSSGALEWPSSLSGFKNLKFHNPDFSFFKNWAF